MAAYRDRVKKYNKEFREKYGERVAWQFGEWFEGPAIIAEGYQDNRRSNIEAYLADRTIKS